ncbi:hypothetical protein D3C72_2571790 [compost metagenome]
MHGAIVVGIPLQFRRHALFGDEYGFTDTANVGVVFVPVGEANADFIHWQTPSFLV